MGTMEITRTIVVLDAADPAAVATFWAGVFGGRVEADPSDGWHSVFVGDEHRLDVQYAPDHVRPAWPSGSPQQIHLDIYVPALGPAHDAVMALGAELLQAVSDASAPSGFQVDADPAGHPFCLCYGAR